MDKEKLASTIELTKKEERNFRIRITKTIEHIQDTWSNGHYEDFYSLQEELNELIIGHKKHVENLSLYSKQYKEIFGIDYETEKSNKMVGDLEIGVIEVEELPESFHKIQNALDAIDYETEL